VLPQAPDPRWGLTQRSLPTGRARVLSYRVNLDVPTELVLHLTRLLRERRREIGTRRGHHVAFKFELNWTWLKSIDTISGFSSAR
jgi:hypothetical protein